MASSADVLYPTGSFTGMSLTKIRTSAQGPEYPIKMQIRLHQNKKAMYVLTSGAMLPSTSVDAVIAANGTVTMSTGPFISMNDATADPGSYIWIRSSADIGTP